MNIKRDFGTIPFKDDFPSWKSAICDRVLNDSPFLNDVVRRELIITSTLANLFSLYLVQCDVSKRGNRIGSRKILLLNHCTNYVFTTSCKILRQETKGFHFRCQVSFSPPQFPQSVDSNTDLSKRNLKIVHQQIARGNKFLQSSKIFLCVRELI